MDRALSKIIEHSLNEIFLIDFETMKFAHANQVGLDNLGYSLSELKHLSPLDLKPIEYHSEVLDKIEQLKSLNIKEVVIHASHIRKNGTTYPVEIHLQLSELDGKKVLIAFIIDTSEIQRELDLLHSVIKGASIGYWDWNCNTGECWVSERFLEMLGYPETAMNNTWESWIALVHPDDAWIGEEAFPAAIETNVPFRIEFRLRHINGNYLWIEASGAVIERDPSNRDPIRITGTHLEISKRRAREVEGEQFHKFFSISPNLMMIANEQGIIQKVNPAASAVLGYAEAELLGHSIYKFIHPDDQEKTVRELENLKSQHSVVDTENRYICKDGSICWLSWSGRYDTGDGCVYATARDITESKQLIQELHNSEEMYRVLAEYSGDGIMRYNREHHHIYASPSIEALVGVPAQDFYGKTHAEMGFPENLCKLWQDSIELAFVTGEPNALIFEADNPAGKSFVDWRVFPELNELGQVGSVISVARDITDSRNAEKELQKMQKLNSLGVLAGGIAHDFNNILTILFGNITLTKNSLEPTHSGYKTLEKAEAAFHRATHLTSQLLTFAKGGDPVKQNVSINQLIQDIVQFDLSGSNVKLVFEPKPDAWLVNVDTSQIAQVFSNLTTNANQSMPEGGHLYIETYNTLLEDEEVVGLSAGRYLKFVIRDEGIGIDEAKINQIFDPYYTTKEAGSGLGLAAVFSIINKHKGQITVRSTLTVGTQFTLYLPAAELKQIAREEHSSKHSILEAEKASLLIMDDEEMILMLASRVLESKGYQVKTALDGEQAISMYQMAIDEGNPYSCVIMDLTIPGGMGGVKALEGILSIDPEAKAIVSSGYAVDPVIANFEDYGFKAIIAKPFTLSALEEVVRAVLKR